MTPADQNAHQQRVSMAAFAKGKHVYTRHGLTRFFYNCAYMLHSHSHSLFILSTKAFFFVFFLLFTFLSIPTSTKDAYRHGY
jgi:hypothetical protein